MITSIRWFVNPPDLGQCSLRHRIYFFCKFCKTNVLHKKNSRDLSNDVLFKIEVRIGVHGLWWNPCTPNSIPLTRFITLVTDSDNHLIEIIFSMAVFNKFAGYDSGGMFVQINLWTKTFTTSMKSSTSVNFTVVQPYSKSNIVSGYMDFDMILVPHNIFTSTVHYIGYR